MLLLSSDNDEFAQVVVGRVRVLHKPVLLRPGRPSEIHNCLYPLLFHICIRGFHNKPVAAVITGLFQNAV